MQQSYTTRLQNEWHRYAVQWDATQMQYLLDDVVTYTFTKDQWVTGGPWVFDQPFFIIMNVAISGDFFNPTPPTASEITTGGEMLVDYIRVYDWVANN